MAYQSSGYLVFNSADRKGGTNNDATYNIQSVFRIPQKEYRVRLVHVDFAAVQQVLLTSSLVNASSAHTNENILPILACIDTTADGDLTSTSFNASKSSGWMDLKRAEHSQINFRFLTISTGVEPADVGAHTIIVEYQEK